MQVSDINLKNRRGHARTNHAVDAALVATNGRRYVTLPAVFNREGVQNTRLQAYSPLGHPLSLSSAQTWTNTRGFSFAPRFFNNISRRVVICRLSDRVSLNNTPSTPLSVLFFAIFQPPFLLLWKNESGKNRTQDNPGV